MSEQEERHRSECRGEGREYERVSQLLVERHRTFRTRAVRLCTGIRSGFTGSRNTIDNTSPGIALSTCGGFPSPVAALRERKGHLAASRSYSGVPSSGTLCPCFFAFRNGHGPAQNNCQQRREEPGTRKRCRTSKIKGNLISVNTTLCASFFFFFPFSFSLIILLKHRPFSASSMAVFSCSRARSFPAGMRWKCGSQGVEPTRAHSSSDSSVGKRDRRSESRASAAIALRSYADTQKLSNVCLSYYFSQRRYKHNKVK